MTDSAQRIISLLSGISVAIWLVGCIGPPKAGGFVLAEIFDDPSVIELAHAAANGQISRIDRLLNDGVPINAIGINGLTPLWIAGSSQNLDGFKHLLSQGADPNIQTFRNSNTMILAAVSSDIRYLEAALAAGGDPHLVSEYDDRTPIFGAIIGRNRAQVRLLVDEYNVELNVSSRRGSPLTTSVSSTMWDITYYLIEKGADPFFHYRDGKSVIEDIESFPAADMERQAYWLNKIRELMIQKGFL